MSIYDDVKASLDEKLESTTPAERIFLTRKEAALYLGMSPRALDRHAKSNYMDLKYSRIGNRALYRLDDVLAFVESRQKGDAL